MTRLNSIQELPPLREEFQQRLAARARARAVIYVGTGTCGVAAGARETLQAIEEKIVHHKLPAQVVSVGCIGMCAKEPLVDIQLNGGSHVLYANIQPDMVPRLLEEHVINHSPVREWVICRLADGEPPAEEPQAIQILPQFRELPFTAKQVRIALGNCGMIDPEKIDEYIARDGYRALSRVLGSWSPEEVIREIKDSGLRGRGGGGFSTGTKWELCRKSPGDTKYVICNADEGDPGAFMDRSILESDPHAVLEGMAIAGYAMGAREGIIYCREEYPLAIDRLETAIAQANELGLLGDHILGTKFSFQITLKGGAGAFVCGEETALIASIEGRRGEPRPRPPFPAVSGLWGKPSNINNVKSYAMSPRIILRGAAWFKNIGSPKSPGTAIFALTGKVKNTGLIEVPMGIPLGDIVFDVGGGIPGGRNFKAVQTGGPLGGCLPASSLNTPVDFDSLQEAGAVMGSGGMIVVDDDTCMVELAKYFLTFAAAESCGKCVPCRIGGQRLLEILGRITEGQGTRKDLDTIRELSAHMMSSSLCGLGQRTAGPVMSVLRFFEEEVLAHIDDQICPAGQCKHLVRAKCVNTCPAGVDTPAYLALIAQGRYTEGLAIHRERNPFPVICGRACPAFCETKCRRAELDESIAIRMTKRFMAENEGQHPWTPEPLGAPEQRQAAARKKVAVIGSGPAGLTAAVRLAQFGYGVTVFEKLPVPGGMMSCAIPEYRLPRRPLFMEIESIQRAGVDIRCGQTLGQDFTLDDLLDREGFSSVVLAIGAHHSRPLGVAGDGKSGVINGLDFLREVALASCHRALAESGPGVPLVSFKYIHKAGATAIPDLHGKRVGVVGGGDVAIDAARVALRLGAREVHVMYRRTGDDMPATHLPEEIEGALHEGVRFQTLVNPAEILGDQHVTGVRLVRQRLAEFDNTARRKPVAMEAESFTLPLDVVIPAVGQAPDLSWLKPEEIAVTRGHTFVVNEAFLTSRPGVFAAGDAVTGPATIVQAIAQGNLVAVAVDEWLRTGRASKPRFLTPRHDVAPLHNLDDFAGAHRPAMPKLDLAKREGNFREVELGLNEAAAQAEAKRCLRCDLEWLDRMAYPRPQPDQAA
ncbi:MAG TPA: FAD-dependent oxidoreductase [Candidatus Acidoferrales bacterium]|nr:FAD-dependent oxidoreductase [Candidatus Acidoferrales bacterium]